MITIPGEPSAIVCVHPWQIGHQYWWLGLPLSAIFVQTRGSPAVTANPSFGTGIPMENAPAVSCRQSVQWHAKMNAGALVTRYLTVPHRQPPLSGKGKSDCFMYTVPVSRGVEANA
jgi:hypothetical protein